MQEELSGEDGKRAGGSRMDPTDDILVSNDCMLKEQGKHVIEN